jgi:hypothetical protein
MPRTVLSPFSAGRVGFRGRRDLAAPFCRPSRKKMNLLPGFMKIMFLMLLLLVPETATACVCPMKLSTRVVLEPGGWRRFQP